MGFDLSQVDPSHKDLVGQIMAALTLAFDDDEKGALDVLSEAKAANPELVVDFMFGAMLGLISGWADYADTDPSWLLQEMGKRSAMMFTGLDPDWEDLDG